MKFVKTALVLALGSTLTIAAQAQNTLDKIRSSGSMTLAYRESSIPFSYLDEKAQPVGFAWELSNKIAQAIQKELGLSELKIKTQAVTSANRMPLLSNGTIDIECGSTTNNKTRQESVDFSVNFFYASTRLLVKADSGINGLDDMKGKILVSTSGTTPLQLMQSTNHKNKLGMRIITANDHNTGFLNVQQGMAQAFAMDDVLLYGARASALKPEDYIVVGESMHIEPYACMVRKNDPEFKAVVDKAIIDLMDSGEFAQMYEKWFTTAIPPKGINLELPMSEELKANLTAHSDAPAD